MLNSIEGYCFTNNIKCQRIGNNYFGKSREKIVDSCKDCNVVLFSSVGNYLDNDMLKSIMTFADTVVVCTDNLSCLQIRRPDMVVYEFKTDIHNLTVRKVR